MGLQAHYLELQINDLELQIDKLQTQIKSIQSKKRSLQREKRKTLETLKEALRCLGCGWSTNGRFSLLPIHLMTLWWSFMKRVVSSEE